MLNNGVPNGLILSNEYLLYFTSPCHLLLFLPDQWITVPLDFIFLNGLRLANVVASDGGLVCLDTECSKFVVFNPLLKVVWWLPNPPQRLFEDPVSALGSSIGWQNGIMPSFPVDMDVTPDSGLIRLVVVTVLHNVSRSFVFDSDDSEFWGEAEDSLFALHCMDFLFCRARAKCMGNLSIFGGAWPGRCNVIAYNFDIKEWISTDIDDSGTHIPRVIFSINGMVLIGAVDIRRGTQGYYQVHDTGNSLEFMPWAFPSYDWINQMREWLAALMLLQESLI
ncbi:unnamed protein product [Calypogeia fissa]